VLFCCCGARLSASRWTDRRNDKYGSTRTKNRSHLAAPRIGVIYITSASGPREWALSGGGALLNGVGTAVARRGTSRRRSQVSLLGLRGGPIRSASSPRVVALPHGGASAAGVATVGHGRRGGVVQRRRHHSFELVGHSGRWPRLERRAGVTRMDRGNRWCRHRAAWRLIRKAVASSHQSRRVMTHSDIRVTRSVRGERPERFTCHGSGLLTVGVTTRRSAGHSGVVALSDVLVSRAHSNDRPTGKWSRRARRSCAILSPRRAAHLQR